MGEREEMANALALVGSSLAFALALARVLWLWPWLALEGLAVLSVLFIGGGELGPSRRCPRPTTGACL